MAYREHCHCFSASRPLRASRNQTSPKTFSLRSLLNLQKNVSGKRKEPKPKLLRPDIFRWGRGLPHERVGAKKLGMSLDFAGISWRCPKSLRKKRFVFNSWPLLSCRQAPCSFFRGCYSSMFAGSLCDFQFEPQSPKLNRKNNSLRKSEVSADSRKSAQKCAKLRRIPAPIKINRPHPKRGIL